MPNSIHLGVELDVRAFGNELGGLVQQLGRVLLVLRDGPKKTHTRKY